MAVISSTITASFASGDFILHTPHGVLHCSDRASAVSYLRDMGYTRDEACEAVSRALVCLVGRP